MLYLKFIWVSVLKPCAEVLFAVFGLFYIAGFITLTWLSIPFTGDFPTLARIIFAVLYWPAILGYLVFYFYDEWVSFKQDAAMRR
jgi:hypothetical protein